jgi:hypothetical protein
MPVAVCTAVAAQGVPHCAQDAVVSPLVRSFADIDVPAEDGGCPFSVRAAGAHGRLPP